ncbi:unnamed protein product [Ectocarpus sp. 13 AM-2016]
MTETAERCNRFQPTPHKRGGRPSLGCGRTRECLYQRGRVLSFGILESPRSPCQGERKHSMPASEMEGAQEVLYTTALTRIVAQSTYIKHPCQTKAASRYEQDSECNLRPLSPPSKVLRVLTLTLTPVALRLTCSRSYTLDEEKVKYNEVTRTRVSEVLSVPCSGPTGFVRSANCSTAGGRDNVHMLETRNVVEGGLSHTQEIRLHNLTTGEDCVTNRVWTRVPMTEEHHAAVGPL